MRYLQKVDLPEASITPFAIQRFTVSEDAAKMGALRGMFSGGRYTPPGTYTRLMRGGTVVMSDTPDEMRDHWEPVHRAHGHVLINGLGLGMVLKAVLLKTEVTAVTVVEISKEVIDLVAPHYDDPRVHVVHASAFDYQPPKNVRYGAVWHDIWDYICGDNLPEMTRLKRKYGRRADWQGCWCEHQCRRRR
jgi:hypothetical protein